jgi:ribose transport system substrate-binding protein
MKKRLLIFFLSLVSLVLGVLLTLSSCPDTQKQKDALTFVFVPGMADPFYYTMERGAKEKAQELGINLIVAEFPNSWGPDVQIPILEAATTGENIDLILIAPTSVDALIAPLKKLHEKGIQIITVDTFLGDGDYSKESEYSFPLSYIGTDNELGGKKIAENLAKLLGETGKVYVNTTTPDTSSVVGRVNGFKAGIAEFPNMEVVGVDYNLDVQETARKQTLAMLQKIPDIVGVFGVNVFSAQGAYRAIVNAGLTGAVKVATWDATKDLINALKEGQVDLVLAQKPAEMGSLAVEWGYKFFKEKAQVPKKVIPGFEFFTRENVNDPNMQQFIYQ